MEVEFEIYYGNVDLKRVDESFVNVYSEAMLIDKVSVIVQSLFEPGRKFLTSDNLMEIGLILWGLIIFQALDLLC